MRATVSIQLLLLLSAIEWTNGFPFARLEQDEHLHISPEDDVLLRIYKVIHEEINTTKDEEAKKMSEFLTRRYFSNSRKKQGVKDDLTGYGSANKQPWTQLIPLSPNPEIPRSSATEVEYPVQVQRAPPTSVVAYAPAVQEVQTVNPNLVPQIVFLSPYVPQQQQQQVQDVTSVSVTAAEDEDEKEEKDEKDEKEKEEKERVEIENPNAFHAIKHLFDALQQGGVNRVKNELHVADITTPRNPAVGLIDTGFSTLSVFVNCQLFRNCSYK